jgi:hypothetical protein
MASARSLSLPSRTRTVSRVLGSSESTRSVPRTPAPARRDPGVPP